MRSQNHLHRFVAVALTFLAFAPAVGQSVKWQIMSEASVAPAEPSAETSPKATRSRQRIPASEQIQQPKSAIGIRGIMAFTIASVDTGSPAERAGLQKGDMITELNGIQVNSIEDLQKIPQNPPGASVEVTYWRFNADTGKDERHQTVVKTSSPGAPSQSRAGIGARGVMVFRVASVDENSPADQVGINRGDLLTAINGAQVSSIIDVLKMAQNPPGASVEVTHWRRNPVTNKYEKQQPIMRTIPE